MLTKSDLNSISDLIETKTRSIVKEEISRELKPIKSDLTKVRGDVNIMLSMFDREYLDLRKRVERLEDHLNLPPISS